ICGAGREAQAECRWVAAARVELCAGNENHAAFPCVRQQHGRVDTIPETAPQEHSTLRDRKSDLLTQAVVECRAQRFALYRIRAAYRVHASLELAAQQV